MPRVKAPINNEILAWARKVLGYDQDFVAEKLCDKKENIEKWRRKIISWESGEDQPTFRQLDQLSDLYYQPAIIFYYDEPPKESELPVDYRKISGDDTEVLEPKTKIAIWEAQWRQSVAESLREEMGIKIRFHSIGTEPKGNADELAQRIREELGITFEIQKQWAKDYGKLYRRWRALLENLGIMVFKFDFPRNNARAFALPSKTAPVITVSSKDYINGNVFSLFHEFAHLLFSQSSTCNDLEFRSHPKSRREKVEVFCNRFAGSILVPAEILIEHPKINQIIPGNQIDETVIKEIARSFGVSQEVILRRLAIIGLIDNEIYREWRTRRKEYWKYREPSGGGGGDEYTHIRKVFSQQGQSYVETILTAYSERYVSLTEASEYLSVNFKNLLKTQEFLYRGGTKL